MGFGGFAYNGGYDNPRGGTAHNAEGKRVARVLSSDMVAHVWNAQSQTIAENSKGSVFFEGRALYSYGRHFPLGYILPDGTAVLNADKYSVTTSGHQGMAAGACRNRPRIYLPSLSAFMGPLELATAIQQKRPADHKLTLAETRQGFRKCVLNYLRDMAGNGNAADLDSRRLAPAHEYPNRWNPSADPADWETAPAWLCRLAGLRLASWDKIKREAAEAAERERKRLAAEGLKFDRQQAERFADMPAVDFGRLIRRHIDSSNAYNSESTAKSFRAEAAKLSKFAKRQAELKLTDRRVSDLRNKAKRFRYFAAELERLAEPMRKRREAREAIETLRDLPRYFGRRFDDMATGRMTGRHGDAGGIAYEDSGRLQRAANAAERLAGLAALPFVSRRRLAVFAERLASLAKRIEAERIRHAEAEAAERRRLAALDRDAKIQAWRDGAAVSVTFDSEHGGAALRVRGDCLETSHGASVPLGHAVRVFQFVKMIREKAQAGALPTLNGEDRACLGIVWKRNGKTIRVGHFQVDSIFGNGDFMAGCHRINWQETEAAARAAGVADLPADDSAVETSKAA